MRNKQLQHHTEVFFIQFSVGFSGMRALGSTKGNCKLSVISWRRKKLKKKALSSEGGIVGSHNFEVPSFSKIHFMLVGNPR